MPEIDPNHVPSPRTALFWDGVAYRPGHVDAAGDIQIDVLSSVMDPLAATAANQALILAQVQLIEDLRDALQSVAADRLIVRGEDQLYSVKSVLAVTFSGPQQLADGYINSPAVPAGELWKVTCICGVNTVRATTIHRPLLMHDGVPYWLGDEERAFPIFGYGRCIGEWWLDQGDYIRYYFIGGLNLDGCSVFLTGHRMTLEV